MSLAPARPVARVICSRNAVTCIVLAVLGHAGSSDLVTNLPTYTIVSSSTLKPWPGGASSSTRTREYERPQLGQEDTKQRQSSLHTLHPTLSSANHQASESTQGHANRLRHYINSTTPTESGAAWLYEGDQSLVLGRTCKLNPDLILVQYPRGLEPVSRIVLFTRIHDEVMAVRALECDFRIVLLARDGCEV